jgi:hypothetical protein
VNGRPVAISDDAMAELFRLATPLDPRDRIRFVESVVAELGEIAEIDLGLIHRVAASVQSRYLGFARGADRARLRQAHSAMVAIPVERMATAHHEAGRLHRRDQVRALD